MELQDLKTNQQNMAEKIDTLIDTVNEIKVDVARLPHAILESADTRYASKASETRLQALETRIESRNYDWLKQTVVTLITVIISMAVYNQVK